MGFETQEPMTFEKLSALAGGAGIAVEFRTRVSATQLHDTVATHENF